MAWCRRYFGTLCCSKNAPSSASTLGGTSLSKSIRSAFSITHASCEIHANVGGFAVVKSVSNLSGIRHFGMAGDEAFAAYGPAHDRPHQDSAPGALER